MTNIPPTITLQIELRDARKGQYPLRLLLHGETGPKEIAKEWIAGDAFDRTKVTANLTFDPIQNFLDQAQASPTFRETGQYLYQLLHQGTVATEWDRLINENERLRVQLELKPADAAAFPWELCQDNTKLALSPDITFTRTYEPKKLPKKPKADSWPIRLLIAIGARDDDADVLPWKEIRRIETEIHKTDRESPKNKLVHRVVDIEILRRPSLAELRQKYLDFKPHIFHFIGHGELDANQKAHLVINFYNPDTKKYEPIEWAAPQIHTTFQGREWLPRFVFINACRSENKGGVREDSRQQSWAIGDVFRELGVPGVLTMQADINGEVAGIFAGTLYKSLAELDSLDEALANARIAITTQIKSEEKREWAIPVLTLAIPPDEVLQLRPTASENRLKEIKDCTLFKEIDLFSDRIEQRRQLFRGFYPLPPDEPNRDLIIVSGDADAGKSWLVRWCMEACALLNNDIRYVEVGGEESKTWLDVLLQIRDGDTSKNNSLLITQPLKASAFYKFNWELDHRFRGNEPANVWDGTIVPPRKIRVGDSTNWTPNFVADTFRSFRDSLIQAAEINNPLIIVLDHFTKNAGISKEEMSNSLIPLLIESAAKRQLREEVSATEVRSVKLVVILTEAEARDFAIRDLVSSHLDVSLKLLTPAAFLEVASEYIRRKKPEWPDADQQKVIDGLEVALRGKLEVPPSDLVRRIG